ncbi:MAG TPA: DNA polymerase III subunit chi [Burkholderiaceae bacterium]|nr:DNA polymerase III subunit chi [Burkholderiaceae bacterium]
MTQVAFHTGIDDTLSYACRLLRKAYRQGARVVVTGSAELLQRLDRQLWIFEPLEFVPHLRLKAGAAPTPHQLRTPIWLAESGARAPHLEVLVNLGPEIPEDGPSFTRIIELVSSDPEGLAAGRQRWRAYETQGLGPVVAKGSS